MTRDFDRTLFASGSVEVGAFRCAAEHPSFRDSGPSTNFCFVFPRTAVEIQHEHERAFVGNPNVVTFYNKGQAYLRNRVSLQGDRCDWFGVAPAVVRDIVREFDPEVDSRPEMPFRLTHARSGADVYLLQRRIFERVATGDALEIEELVINLLARVMRCAYGTKPRVVRGSQREMVHRAELVLSERYGEDLTLGEIAREVEASIYHLCRVFRLATGLTLHKYRHRLRTRAALDRVGESRTGLADIALESGFSSHSHFTQAFRAEFGVTPSTLRSTKARF
jgi:AraC-like DNA-binding protein